MKFLEGFNSSECRDSRVSGYLRKDSILIGNDRLLLKCVDLSFCRFLEGFSTSECRDSRLSGYLRKVSIPIGNDRLLLKCVDLSFCRFLEGFGTSECRDSRVSGYLRKVLILIGHDRLQLNCVLLSLCRFWLLSEMLSSAEASHCWKSDISGWLRYYSRVSVIRLSVVSPTRLYVQLV